VELDRDTRLFYPVDWRRQHRCLAFQGKGIDSGQGSFGFRRGRIFGLDHDAKVTFVNRAAADLLGWEPTEVAGRPLREIFRHSRTDGSLFTEEDSPIINALRESTKQSGTDHFFSRDGRHPPAR
jgi:PAS domain-containing protein